MGFTFSLKMVGTKILVPGSWYQDLWGNRSQGDGGTGEKVKPVHPLSDKDFERHGL